MMMAQELEEIKRLTPGSTEEQWASFYQAQCLLASEDTPSNRARARELLLRAEKGPATSAASMLTCLLRTMAVQADAAEAAALLAEAELCERKHAVPKTSWN